MKITLSMLQSAGACREQVDAFNERFGSKVDVTEELCLSVFNAFDWDWAAANLLPAAARAEYERAVIPAWAEYERAVIPVWAEYERARALARALAWAEYERTRALAWAEYERAQTRAFARAALRLPLETLS